MSDELASSKNSSAGYDGNTPGRNSHRLLPLLQVLLEELRNPLAALDIHESGTAARSGRLAGLVACLGFGLGCCQFGLLGGCLGLLVSGVGRSYLGLDAGQGLLGCFFLPSASASFFAAVSF